MDMNAILAVALVGALILAGLALTVGWVLCLIHAAQEERWGWFVVMLVVSAAAFLYFFLHFEWPADRQARLQREGQRGRHRGTAAELEDLRLENEALRRRIAEGA